MTDSLTVDRVLTLQEASSILKRPIGWLREQLSARGRSRTDDPLPYRKLGRFVYFDRLELADWWERQKAGRP